MDHFYEFLSHHYTLALTGLVVIILIGINEWFAQYHRAQTITTAKMLDLINHEDAVILDLRDEESFRAGHIIRAIRSNPNDIQKSKKYKTIPIVLICAVGDISTATALNLKKSGFEQVHVLSGGMSSWRAAELPLIKGK